MKSLVLTAAFILTSLSTYALEVNEQAPCVVLNQIDANNSESDHCIRDRHPQQKFALVEFFSITCSDCAANLPYLTALANEVQVNATTRLVSIDRKELEIRKFISDNRSQIPFETALDTARDAKKAYGVSVTPTLFVLDENNKIVYKHSGVLNSQDIVAIRQIILGN